MNTQIHLWRQLMNNKAYNITQHLYNDRKKFVVDRSDKYEFFRKNI